MENKNGSKKVNFSIAERISILNIMPDKDNFERLIIREEILEKVKLKINEIDKYDIQTTEKGITWNDDGATFGYTFNKTESNYIRDNLKKLSEENKLEAGLLRIYKTFV